MKRPQRGEGWRREREAWESLLCNTGYIEEPEKHTLVAIVSKTDRWDSQWTFRL